MSLKIPRPIWYIIGVAIGVPASFVAGAAVFANGGVPIISAERIVPVVATYLGLGAVFGFALRLAWPAGPAWRWGLWIGMPAFLTVGLLGRDVGPILQLLYLVVVLGSACLGTLVGALPAAALRRGANGEPRPGLGGAPPANLPPPQGPK